MLGFIQILFFFCLSAVVSAATVESSESIKFRVFLNEDEIGYQQVNLQREGNRVNTSIDAKLKVKVLFINAYSYTHSAQEVWQDQCLVSIETNTKENSNTSFVKGQMALDKFLINSHKGENALSGCIRSFAYWDVSRLSETKLLNGETGEHVDAQLSAKGETQLMVQDKSVTSEHYVLRAEGADINLYYDLDKNWIGLKTIVKGGRTLAYYRTPNILAEAKD
ncbi:MAG: hypothetical protein ACI9FR_001907 [Cryomorphaceae bacterium]|jgi:hypothetical protein